MSGSSLPGFKPRAARSGKSLQIAAALIAFLLLRLAHTAQSAVSKPLAFARLVRINLTHRRRLDRLLDNPPPSRHSHPDQLALQWT